MSNSTLCTFRNINRIKSSNEIKHRNKRMGASKSCHRLLSFGFFSFISVFSWANCLFFNYEILCALNIYSEIFRRWYKFYSRFENYEVNRKWSAFGRSAAGCREEVSVARARRRARAVGKWWHGLCCWMNYVAMMHAEAKQFGSLDEPGGMNGMSGINAQHVAIDVVPFIHGSCAQVASVDLKRENEYVFCIIHFLISRWFVAERTREKSERNWIINVNLCLNPIQIRKTHTVRGWRRASGEAALRRRRNW